MKISTVIRTRNEASYIVDVMTAVRNQNVSTEIILVDNMSHDNTVELASPFADQILTIESYTPGLALNRGIEASSGEIIVILSGHCKPLNNDWLANLTMPFSSSSSESAGLAGVYGRQVPTEETSAVDAKDLLTVFGPESRVQRIDPFFHNANSALLRSVWQETPFNSEASNVEDRIWARDVQSRGLWIAYQPNAVVSHWHGVNHNADEHHASSVLAVLSKFRVYS